MCGWEHIATIIIRGGGGCLVGQVNNLFSNLFIYFIFTAFGLRITGVTKCLVLNLSLYLLYFESSMSTKKRNDFAALNFKSELIFSC